MFPIANTENEDQERLKQVHHCLYGCGSQLIPVSITWMRERWGEVWKKTTTYRYRCPSCDKRAKVFYTSEEPMEPGDNSLSVRVIMTLDGEPGIEREW